MLDQKDGNNGVLEVANMSKITRQECYALKRAYEYYQSFRGTPAGKSTRHYSSITRELKRVYKRLCVRK